jgi:uncharacterized membrane protein (DUF4010 family)
VNDLAHVIENSAEWRLFTAIAIGLLIGIERERHKQHQTDGAPEGMRSFALISLLGGLSAQTGSSVVLGLAGFFTVLVVAIGYWTGTRQGSGITTEVALVIALVLGMLAQNRPGLALSASVVVVLVIASRAPLHRLVREYLTAQDLRDGLVFFIAALVVLPLLPDRAVDPFGLFNPFALWRLAVVLMGLSALGYWAMRAFGPRYGLPISGFAGGFVSSTAAIATMGARAKADPRLIIPCAAGGVASILGSLLFLIALVGAADPAILWPLVKPFGVGLAATMAYALVLAWRARVMDALPTGSSQAFDLRMVSVFVGLVAVFSLVSWALINWLGETAVLASIIATALIDAHAAAVSVATLVASGKLDIAAGAFAILTGLSVNMLAKVPAAFALGPPAFARRVTAGLLILVIGLWAGYGWSLV